MKKRKSEGEEEEEEEEACRNWSLWKENNFDLLSINKTKTPVSVCRGSASEQQERRHMKYL